MPTGLVRPFRLLQAYLPHATCAAELGSVFYSVKEKNFDSRGDQTQNSREFSKQKDIEREMARQREE